MFKHADGGERKGIVWIKILDPLNPMNLTVAWQPAAYNFG